MTLVGAGVVMGIGATAIMDAWNLFLWRCFRIPSLDYCLLGRWVRHMPGTFRHASLTSAPRRSGECLVGWITHYAIGISLAVAFVISIPGSWLAVPTVAPALFYGILTVGLPFFVLQPALGLGIASARAQRPGLARLKSLVTHIVFGGGLYLLAAVLAWQ